MKAVIKLGGTLLEEAAERSALAKQLASAAREHELAVVHGGGKQVTKYLADRGVESRFSGGLRVSDANVIEAVVNVIAGGVNKRLVAALIAAGVSGVGLSGIDGSLTMAEPWDPALGFVGKPARTEGRLLDLLTAAGYVPVVACLAGDADGNIYNVNADQMAVSCALGWQAEHLIFLTDVAGVKGAGGELLATLNPAAIDELISTGVASGGMQAKLEAALTGVRKGISKVTIASGRESNVCARLLAQESVGTGIALD